MSERKRAREGEREGERGREREGEREREREGGREGVNTFFGHAGYEVFQSQHGKGSC